MELLHVMNIHNDTDVDLTTVVSAGDTMKAKVFKA